MTFTPNLRANSSLSRLLCLFSIAMWACVVPVSAQSGFISFDAPDAGKGVVQGTVPWAINQSGVIAGYYIDTSNLVHGFVRTVGGSITEFDATGLSSTFVSGINSKGQIVGSGDHPAGHTDYVHGYLRNPNGNFIHIDPAGPKGSQNTLHLAINDSGEISGTYIDLAGVAHGFLRSSSGVYTVVDAPNVFGQGTFITAINANGEVTGYYNDATTFTIRGFTRDSAGNFAVFDAPGAGGNLGSGTFPGAINLNGEVSGIYVDNSFVSHAFVRDSSGNITDYSVSTATQSYAISFNDGGTVLGQWTDSSSVQHGYLRSPSGTVNAFTVPFTNLGTYAQGINNTGHMTGYYYDLSSASHGFAK